MPSSVPFNPKTYQVSSKATALAGLASAHNLDIERFIDLLDASTLLRLSDSLKGVPDANDWWRWLVYDACLERYKDISGVVGALHIDD